MGGACRRIREKRNIQAIGGKASGEGTTRNTKTLGVDNFKMNHVRFEVFTTVTMKNAVFSDITPCGSWKNRRFGGTYRSPIGVTLMMEIRSS
jgi:hypothetical protein